MQGKTELFALISAGRPDIPSVEIERWCKYLLQLKGCKLHSVASPQKDEAEWLRHRRVGIGGSEIAAIMGENEWNSPRQIWMSKIGMFDDKPATKSEPATWGNLLEDVVAAEWSRRSGVKYVHIPVILVDEGHEYRMANVDGFTLSDDGETITGILEIKTTSAYNKEYWETGPIPFNYICQTNWYCGITRLDNYTIVCLVGGQNLFYHTLLASADLFERECSDAATFWLDYVQKGIEPAATHVDLESAKEVVQDLTLPPLIITDEGEERLIEAYINIREEYAKMKKLKDALYAQLFLMIGQHTEAVSSQRVLAIKNSNRRSCSWDLLKQKYPAAYEECVFTSSSRSLEVK